MGTAGRLLGGRRHFASHVPRPAGVTAGGGGGRGGREGGEGRTRGRGAGPLRTTAGVPPWRVLDPGLDRLDVFNGNARTKLNACIAATAHYKCAHCCCKLFRKLFSHRALYINSICGGARRAAIAHLGEH